MNIVRGTTAFIVTTAAVCTLGVAAGNAIDIAFVYNGLFIDGDSWTTRSRAVVDSGFVHQPIPAGFGLPPSAGTWRAKARAALTSGALRVHAYDGQRGGGSASHRLARATHPRASSATAAQASSPRSREWHGRPLWIGLPVVSGRTGVDQIDRLRLRDLDRRPI